MAAVKGTITVPGSTGTQAITVTNPKAIVLWGTYTTQANGSEADDGFFGIGFGTFRGGAVQQGGVAQHDDDATASATYTVASWNDALLKLITTANTLDAVVTLDSMSSTQVVLNWTDLPATGSLILHYLILTDAEVSDARVHEWTTTTNATDNITVAAGFGQPHAVLLCHPGIARAAHGLGRGDLGVGLGAFTDNTHRFAFQLWGDDAASTMDVVSSSAQRAVVGHNAGGTKTLEIDPSATGSWPTDGYQVTNVDDAAGFLIISLALKLASGASVTVGNTTTLTSGGPQDLAHSAAPTSAFLFGVLDALGLSQFSSGTTGGIWASGWDGTNEGGAGALTQSATANSQAGRWSRNDKALNVYRVPGSATTAPTIDAQADGSASGSNLRLTYTNFSSVARAFGYLIFAAAAGGPTQVEASGTAAITSTATGAATAKTEASGTAAVASAATAAATARTLATGTTAITSGATGTATARTEATGTAAITSTATGAATARTEATGNAAITSTATAAATARTEASGTAAITSGATGTATATGTVEASGTAAITSSATGAATARTLASGTAAITSTATGTATVPGAVQASGTAAITSTAVAAATVRAQATGNATIVLTALGVAAVPVAASGTALILATAHGTASLGAIFPNHIGTPPGPGGILGGDPGYIAFTTAGGIT